MPLRFTTLIISAAIATAAGLAAPADARPWHHGHGYDRGDHRRWDRHHDYDRHRHDRYDRHDRHHR